MAGPRKMAKEHQRNRNRPETIKRRDAVHGLAESTIECATAASPYWDENLPPVKLLGS